MTPAVYWELTIPEYLSLRSYMLAWRREEKAAAKRRRR